MQNNLFNGPSNILAPRLHDETIEVGKVQNSVSLIYSVIIGIFLCDIAYYWYKQMENLKETDKNDFVEISATITEAKCNFYQPEKSQGKYSCNLQLLILRTCK